MSPTGLTDSIERELLGPVLALPRAAATEITTLFAEEVLGLVAPRQIPLATFIEDLLEPARITSWREPEPEEPEVDEELADPQRYDDAALAAAARIFEGARRRRPEARTSDSCRARHEHVFYLIPFARARCPSGGSTAGPSWAMAPPGGFAPWMMAMFPATFDSVP